MNNKSRKKVRLRKEYNKIGKGVTSFSLKVGKTFKDLKIKRKAKHYIGLFPIRNTLVSIEIKAKYSFRETLPVILRNLVLYNNIYGWW